MPHGEQIILADVRHTHLSEVVELCVLHIAAAIGEDEHHEQLVVVELVCSHGKTIKIHDVCTQNVRKFRWADHF